MPKQSASHPVYLCAPENQRSSHIGSLLLDHRSGEAREPRHTGAPVSPLGLFRVVSAGSPTEVALFPFCAQEGTWLLDAAHLRAVWAQLPGPAPRGRSNRDHTAVLTVCQPS